MKSKVVNVSEALDLIRGGDTLAISAVGSIGYPDYVAAKLEERYIERNSPGGLTLYSAGGHGSFNAHCNDSRFAHPGFLKRHVCTHPKVVPDLRDMIENNELEGYVLPQGVLNQLYRCSAARQPGILTKIGVGTYVDPRQEGGKMNSVTKEDLVRVVEMDGEEWLYYKSVPVNIAMIRGTYADEKGNMTIEREPLKLEMLEIALAAKASGGKVIVQVERVVENYSLKAKDVVVPGQLVDAVVVTEQPEIYHKQSGSPIYNPYISGEARSPAGAAPIHPSVLNTDDIMCRRAAFELFPEAIINLGVGVGSGTGMVAAAEGLGDMLNFTLELGVFGGTPLAPPNFGVSMNPESYVSPPTMFDFYHGGNLDVAILGAAEVDKDGNVNVSRFAGHPNGQGGFIDISQMARKVVFCTNLRTKGFEGEVSEGRLRVVKEGQLPKFVEKVDQITFNGKVAFEAGHEVYYITERAVFKLEKEGVALIEIAPGVDLEKDILGQMGFRPRVSGPVKVMDDCIFRPGKMGMIDRWQ
ncbi:MAG: acyl CoA:acetate/3-ketoacid CoA transferase [Peptococcaceae bacterium]|nr:acyl CoA:acetate/3-ketoacid CoA transferase [Peptococcaceae bacterium]